jgi:ribosome-binding factor A
MPKDFNRIDRIGELIQHEVAALLLREMQDPRVKLVSITHVNVSRDLSFARIYITQLNEEKINETLKVLNKASNHLRFLLAKKIQLRVIPQLKFYYDASIKESNELSILIDEAIAEDKSRSEEEDDDDE